METANQIAAGEVAEKPAFIIKELIENAIDAGGTRIRIVLKESGISQIRITDNGIGIGQDDMPLAFMRHATSKISQIGDLAHLSTLGFRGEALPSIAAVSRMRLRSMVRGADSAYEISLIGGEMEDIQPVAANPGTEVIVDDLFYNTPARKKFLRSPIRELADISDLVARLILSRPDISFELVNNEKRIYLSPGNHQVKAAVMSVFGQEAAASLLPLTESDEVTGFISHPSYHKASRQYYNIFINGRYIKSQELNHVLDLAYQHRLPERRYPLVVLYLHLDAKDFDVNVHPNKIEVKLDPRSTIKEILVNSIQEALLTAEKSYRAKLPAQLRSPAAEQRAPEERGPMPRYGEKVILPPSTAKEENMSAFFAEVPQVQAAPKEMPPARTGSTPADDTLFVPEVQGGVGEPAAPLPDQGRAVEAQEALSFGEGFYRNLHILGQLGGMFILAENGEALYIIDQHAAHERLLYNRFKAQVKDSQESQSLLTPLELGVNHFQYVWILQWIVSLRTLGFILEDFGDNTFILRGIPGWATHIDPIVFLKDLADYWLRQKGKITTADILDEKIIMHSCKSAIKGNQYLTNSDISYLLQQLDEGEDVFTCPHGRPITIKITVNDLKKWFLRT